MVSDRGGSFDFVREWANIHLRELLREYAPEAFAKLRGDRCPCPIHGGDGPNFSLFSAPDGRGELWRCHSACNTGGGGVELVQAMTGRPGKAGAVEVLRELAPRAGVSLVAGPTRWPPIWRPPARPRTFVQTSRPTSAPAPVADDGLAPLRVVGIIPASPVAVHTATVRHLTLGAEGADYLTGRGFDPDAAHAYGFRSLDTRADWDALEVFLAENFDPAERAAAGLGTRPDLYGTPALMVPYRTADGAGYAGIRLRSLTGKAYRSLAGFTLPVPFNAPALTAPEVHIVEGELNAYTLHLYGLAAVGLDGAGKWRPEWTATLRQAARVVAWYDTDDAGGAGRRKLADTLAVAFGWDWVHRTARTVTIPKRAGCKDANDLHQRGELAPLIAGAEWRTN